MAYSWCRYTIPRDTLERYAGGLEIFAKTKQLDCKFADMEFARGAAASLRTIIAMDGETDTETFVGMVMSMSGGNE